VAFLSPGLWSHEGALAALRAAHRSGRRIVFFHEEGGFGKAVAGRPPDLALLVSSDVVSKRIERSGVGGARAHQVRWFLEQHCGVVHALAVPDALPPSLPPPSALPATIEGARDAAVAALLHPSAPCAVVLTGPSGVGKSTAAAAAASDPRILSAFDDVVCVALGQACRARVLRVLQEALSALHHSELRPPRHGAVVWATEGSGDPHAVSNSQGSLEATTGLLRAACARRSVLIVVDDVW
jgi:hypothetical protein